MRAAPGSVPDLQVSLETADGSHLAAVPVNDCRFIDRTIGETDWAHVRIPVSALDPAGLYVARVNIADRSGTAAWFWVDDPPPGAPCRGGSRGRRPTTGSTGHRLCFNRASNCSTAKLS